MENVFIAQVAKLFILEVSCGFQYWIWPHMVYVLLPILVSFSFYGTRQTPACLWFRHTLWQFLRYHVPSWHLQCHFNYPSSHPEMGIRYFIDLGEIERITILLDVISTRLLSVWVLTRSFLNGLRQTGIRTFSLFFPNPLTPLSRPEIFDLSCWLCPFSDPDNKNKNNDTMRLHCFFLPARPDKVLLLRTSTFPIATWQLGKQRDQDDWLSEQNKKWWCMFTV